jgi:hypothetical protein
MIVVDPDPDSLGYVRDASIPVIVGSLGNEEVIEKLPMRSLELVVVTVPDYEQNLFFLDHFRKHNKKAIVIISTQSMQEALELYKHGASYVHVTSFIEDAAVQNVLAGSSHEKLQLTRQAHISRLEKIVARSGTAVDIDEFVSRLATRQIPRAAQDIHDRARRAVDDAGRTIGSVGRSVGGTVSSTVRSTVASGERALSRQPSPVARPAAKTPAKASKPASKGSSRGRK